MCPSDPEITQVQERPRVLVIEDNFVIGMSICSQLDVLGFASVGPVASLAEGLRRAKDEQFDGAILDVNIRGGTSELIARALEDKSIPFFFVTGYASPLHFSEKLRAHMRLTKPITTQALREAMEKQFRTAG